MRIKPGAFSWNQGEELVLKTVPHAKESKHPAETALKNTLSRRMLPLYTPVLATASITSRGEKESKFILGRLAFVAKNNWKTYDFFSPGQFGTSEEMEPFGIGMS